jgi:hypothetical protein
MRLEAPTRQTYLGHAPIPKVDAQHGPHHHAVKDLMQRVPLPREEQHFQVGIREVFQLREGPHGHLSRLGKPCPRHLLAVANAVLFHRVQGSHGYPMVTTEKHEKCVNLWGTLICFEPKQFLL